MGRLYKLPFKRGRNSIPVNVLCRGALSPALRYGSEGKSTLDRNGDSGCKYPKAFLALLPALNMVCISLSWSTMLYGITILFFILSPFALGADSKNNFKNPSSWTDINPVWTIGETQVIAWETTLGEFNISFWQQSIIQESAASQGNVYSKIHSSDKVSNFTWTVQLYGFDLDYSNVFFFWINSDTPEGFTSAYFNISEPDATSTTDGTATHSPSSITNTTSSISSSTASDTPPTTPPSSEQTTTSKIALGVGIGIGLPVLAALAFIIWLRMRPSTEQNQTTKAVLPSPPELYGDIIHQPPHPSPKEVHGSEPPRVYPELPSRPYT
ncbi:uncharacterized protein APUU_50131A [Aspergillus puulaauensis]|uniref:Mid2 domain-containing protein n=1 Tax=Aspergillus puulaauensis TaxID=1220207 RepID=A0A7R8AQ97_9EURO|nr:uncharacterized protein APUU_50131A [Aspergillus puulaauensis]BCS25420.1 hypothetical protein APUU_50131A [Aspergillus puulaauensis]